MVTEEKLANFVGNGWFPHKSSDRTAGAVVNFTFGSLANLGEVLGWYWDKAG